MAEYFKDAEAFKEGNGYTINGAWYPRVTRIVSIKSKPGLSNFYNEVGMAGAKAISEKSAEEGTLVHQVAESIILGEDPEIPQVIEPAMGALRSFLSSKDIEVERDNVERRILHPEHRYAGTIDVIARINGRLGVLDIKTSQAIYRDYNLQTAAYVEALLPEFPEISTRWILRIDQSSRCAVCGANKRVKGGREKVRPPRGGVACADHDWLEVEGIVEVQEFPQWKSDFEAFLGAKKLWEWENEWWLKKIGYLSLN
jgi:hypothetical protein